MEVRWSGVKDSMASIVEWMNTLTAEYEIMQFQIVPVPKKYRGKDRDRALPDWYLCVALIKPLLKPDAFYRLDCSSDNECKE